MNISITKDSQIFESFSYHTGFDNTTSKWTYTPTMTFDPTHVIINNVNWYRDGTQTGITLMLVSSLFSFDDRQMGALFMEQGTANAPFMARVHKLSDKIRQSTFEFRVFDPANPSTNPLSSASDKVTVDLTFIKLQ